MPETAHDTAELLRRLQGAFRPGDRAVMEKVNSMPSDGHMQAFRFGENFGVLQGLLAGLGIPYDFASPQAWQKRVGALPKEKGDRKNALKAFAQRRYPHLKVTLATADALAMLAVLSEGKSHPAKPEGLSWIDEV